MRLFKELNQSTLSGDIFGLCILKHFTAMLRIIDNIG